MTAIDRSSLDLNTGADAELIRDILVIFRSQMVPEARQVPIEADPLKRSRSAHRIRGAALGIGALDLARAATVLEGEAPDASDFAAYVAALGELEREIDVMLAGR